MRDLIGGSDDKCKKKGKSRIGTAGVVDYSRITCEPTNSKHGSCSKNKYGNCTFHQKCGYSKTQRQCKTNTGNKKCKWVNNKCIDSGKIKS